jgi:hypothetical protein
MYEWDRKSIQSEATWQKHGSTEFIVIVSNLLTGIGGRKKNYLKKNKHLERENFCLMRNRKGRVLYFDERATRWNPMK